MSTGNTPTKATKSCELYPYPTCWQDDARVQVLLAPFRDRSVNPESYDSKIKFWEDTIKEYCFYKGKANFCKQELQYNFTKGQRVPCCFDTVLEEMQRKKLIRLRKDYEYDPENSWSGWAVNNFLKKPLYWGLHKIKAQFGSSEANLGLMQYIHLEVISKFCSELQETLFQPPYIGTLYHYCALQKEICTALNISEECLRICLYTLSIKRKIGLEYKPNANELQIHLVKIPSKKENDVNITETDHAIHNLQVTQKSLETQLEEIEVDIQDKDNKVRQYIKENNRLMAKTFLRKKKLLEKNHERRSLALHNIETLLSNVHEATLNGVILDAYKFGSKALQNALKSSNLNYDNVDEIISDVRETMDSFMEVQNGLANANVDESLGSLAEDDELEKELKAIMGESCDTSPVRNPTDYNNKSVSMSLKEEITDAELLDMLNGLEIEQKRREKIANNKLAS